MADVAQIWNEALPTVKEGVTGVGVWTALNAATPIALEDGTFVLGLPNELGELIGHLKMAATKRLIEVTMSELAIQPITLRVIGGIEQSDWDVEKRRDVEKQRLNDQAMTKMRAQMSAKSNWEGVYEQLGRRFAAVSSKSLPQNRARFYEEAVALIAEARQEMSDSDDLGERNFARCMERLAQYAEIPSTVVAIDVLRRAKRLLMPTVVVLGSGTSNGIPMLGFHYPSGYLDHPKNHRTRCSIALLGQTGNFLVDCPPELRLQMTREQIYEVDGVLITHTHADHVMGMDDLRSLCLLQKIKMPIYTLPRYQTDIQRIFPYAFPPYPEGVEVPKFDLREVPESLEVGGITLRFFQAWHGKQTPVIGLRCKDFAYLTDVSEIPLEAEALLQDLDVLILDAVRLRPHPNHFNLEQALAKIAELKPRHTYLTHLSHDYDHDRTNAELPAGVELAFDGLRIEC